MTGNDAHSSVIGFSQTEEKTTLKMFTCRNGEWELSGQLLPVLYPVMDCWEKIEITIGKETVHKYQKK